MIKGCTYSSWTEFHLIKGNIRGASNSYDAGCGEGGGMLGSNKRSYTRACYDIEFF